MFKKILIASTLILTAGSAFALSPSSTQIFNAKSCDQVLTNGGYFQTCYSYEHKAPDRGMIRLDGKKVFAGNIEKRPSFFTDKSLPKNAQSLNSSYTHSGFDRGHSIAADADLDWSLKSQLSTYAMSNIVPQYPQTNRKSYLKVEKLGRKVAAKLGYADVVTLNFFGKGLKPVPANIPKAIGREHVSVPVGFGRIISNTDQNYRKCFYIPNDNVIHDLRNMETDCSSLLRAYRMGGNN